MFRLIPTEYTYEKGGGQSYVPPPDYEAQARANTQTLEAQARIDREAQERDRMYQVQERDRAEVNANREKEAAALQRQQDIEKSQGRLNSAYEASLGDARSKLTQRGIDPSNDYGIMGAIQSAYGRSRQNAPEIVTNPGDYFSPTAFDDAFNTAQSTQRTGLQKKWNGVAGTGFENNLFADTADDSFLDAILGEQYTDANATLDRQYARGQLNAGTKQQALNGLSKQKLAARSKMEDLGLGVIQGYRDQARNYDKGVRGQLENYSLGDAFDIDQQQTGLNSLRDRLMGRLEGDIYSTIGDQNFLDLDTILGKAGNASGVNNAPVPGLAGNAPVVAGITEDELMRTLGTSGSF